MVLGGVAAVSGVVVRELVGWRPEAVVGGSGRCFFLFGLSCFHLVYESSASACRPVSRRMVVWTCLAIVVH